MILKSKLQKLSLDFNQTSFHTIHAKQYDKRSRFLTIYCTENGQFVPLSDGLTVHIKMLTPDGRAILHTVPIQDDGSLLVELTETMLSFPGTANAEIRIYNTEEEALLSTMSFYVLIEPSVYEDGRIIASDEYNALTELMESASKNYEYVMENAQKSADAAKESEENTALMEDAVRALWANAAESEQKAKESEENAYANASSAKEHSDTASSFASDANLSSQNAQNSAKESSDFAKTAESFAHGGTGARPGEDMDNAEYYYNQSKTISESFAGALRPMGTVLFANLPGLPDAAEGDMYNISDSFTTTNDFKEGAGFPIPPGANIYKTADGTWDVLAGTPVTGVKGNSEASYRRGNVNLTPENIGALPQNGNALSATKAMQDGNGNNIDNTYLKKNGDSGENTAVYTSGDAANPSSWADVAVMTSGEKHMSLFNKLTTMAKNVRWLYKMLGTTNISGIGGGTLTGAISALNTGLAEKSDGGHTHDDRYYTEAEINSKINLLTCTNASVNVGYTTDGATKSVANNTRTVMTTITISKPGYYILTAATIFSKNATGLRFGTFSSTSNGASNTGTLVKVSANSSDTTAIQNVYLTRTTAANTKVYFAVQQTSGGALSVTTWISSIPVRCT